MLFVAILFTPALWADEVADRAAVEATISALSISPSRAELFTAGFPNAAELRRFLTQSLDLSAIQTGAGTLVISREPMGEATWYPALPAPIMPRFVTRSVAFVSPDTAIVVATYNRQSVLFVVKNESSRWRIASFRTLPEARVLPEAQTKAVP